MKIKKEKIKTWLVTGASSGIGHILCKQLLKEEYNVIAIARKTPQLVHENVLCLSCDVTCPEVLNDTIQKGIEHFGKIDVLFNNAGVSCFVTIEEDSLEHSKEVMDVNFFGAFNTIHALLPHFRQNKNGTIINNTSMHGITLRYAGGTYCASKHALEGLNSVLWHETKSFCRVMAVELGGYSDTNISSASMKKPSSINEYKEVSNFYKNIIYYFDNDLEQTIRTIISQVEEQKLPRRLIIGKDAHIKIAAEIKYLQKDLRYSKTKTKSCSHIKKDLIKKVIKKIIK